MNAHGRSTRPTLVVLAALIAWTGVAAAQPLRRDLSAYALFALRKATLKDLSVTGPCNVGVDCADTNKSSGCGVLRLEDATFAPGSQTVADLAFFNKPGAVVFQLFRNGGGSLANVTITDPPVQSFATPIIPGTCSANCVPDFGAIESLCGFASPFPACDPTRNVTVEVGKDCPPFDATPGNNTCDLVPGTYGDVEVRNGATLLLQAGTYAVCMLNAARQTRVLGSGVLIDVADGGVFRVNSGSTFGQSCGDIAVHVAGVSTVAFGRNASITANVCAPRTAVSLGHNNVLTGQFVGDTLDADASNQVNCCAGRCTCFDDISPTSAAVGASVTLSSHCDLKDATGVRVCGKPAQITTQTTDTIVFTVPAGASGACDVEVLSSAGSFVHVTKLNVP